MRTSEKPDQAMNILALDSSTEYLQFRLSRGPRFIERVYSVGLQHAERFAPAVETLLSEFEMTPRELDGIVCSRGPGSFTGLRIGMASAKAFSAALGIPLHSISSLDAIAEALPVSCGYRISAIDARKQRFYCRIDKRLDGQNIAESMDTILKAGDLGAAEIYDRLINDNRGNTPQFVTITGPHAEMLHEQLKAIALSKGEPDSLNFIKAQQTSWIGSLSELGSRGLAAGLSDDPAAGPDYLRVSEAELGITPPK